MPEQRAHDVHLCVASAGIRPGAIDLLENHRRFGDSEPAATVLRGDENREPSRVSERLDESLGIRAIGLDALPVVTAKSTTQLANRFAVFGVQARLRIDVGHSSPRNVAATSAHSASERTVSSARRANTSPRRGATSLTNLSSSVSVETGYSGL